MSTKGNREFRPACHFAPKSGWVNDPNGLFYENGTWHLFSQYYPETFWGPMHWLRSSSTDLLHWQQHDIALYPDEKLGFIFSGSAIVDKGNTSGLGKGGDPVVLMFTHHMRNEHTVQEQQSIAWSDDRVHYHTYEGNPVIPNADKMNFRDPKLFRNEKLNCWGMVLAAGDHAEFYASDDLIHWRKTGDFGQKENKLGGVFECTDLFPLKAPDGSEVWVLIVSTALPAPFGSGRMQYFLGEFDGETFRETYPSDLPRLFDSGYDDYAAVSFSGADRVLMVGWAASPGYADQMPTGEFCCAYTYVREMSLAQTDRGLMLAAKPITPDFELAGVEPEKMPEGLSMKQKFRYVPRAEAALPGELFHVRVEAEGPFTLSLSNDDGEALNVSVSTEQKLVVDRTRAGWQGFSAPYDSGLFAVTTAPRSNYGPATVDVYFDKMLAEVFVDGGTVVNTSMVFPEKPYTKATLMGRAKLWVGTPKE